MKVSSLVHLPRRNVAHATTVDFHLRMIWVATVVAWVTIGVISLAVLVLGTEPNEKSGSFLFVLLAVASLANFAAYLVPWREILSRFDPGNVFTLWSLALFAFCSSIVYFTPSLDNQVYLLYFPAMLFAVASLNARRQVAMILFGFVSYAIALRLAEDLPPGELLLRLAALVLVAFLGSYISSGQRQMVADNAQLYEESRRAAEELRRVFSRFGKALASSLDLDKTLHLVTDLAVEMLGAQGAMLVLFDADGDAGSTEASSGGRQEDLRRLQKQAGDWLVPGVVRSRTAVQVADIPNDHRFQTLEAEFRGSLGSYLAVPMLLRGKVIGLLAVIRGAGSFPAREVDLLGSFANQAAIAIENARLFAALQERLRELSGLREISLAFAALTRLEDTYGQIVERIGRLIDAERCVILLADEQDRELIAQAPAYGLTPNQISTMRITIDDQSAAGRVWLSGRPYMTNDAQTDPRNIHQWARAFDDRSLVIVPMRVEGRTVGLMRASNKRGARFTNNDVRLLTIFATQAAVALRNAMLYREVAYERARLEAIFDHASDGIMIVDGRGRIVAFNRAMEFIGGWKADEAVGKPCRAICGTEDEQGRSLCDTVCPLNQLCDPGELGQYMEGRIVTKDGERRDVGVSYSRLESPEGETYGVAIMRDISKSKELERVKSRFIYAISHELRTPLASIKASIGLLLESVPQSIPDPLVRLLHNIDRSARRLESVSGDILDLARLQSGRVTLVRRRVDLREVLNAAIATIRPLAQSRHQAVEARLPQDACYAMGDRQRLEHVVLNLLSNANKYTPQEGTIGVAIQRVESDDELAPDLVGSPQARLRLPGWKIIVSDNGQGIPVQEQDHIFESFYRGEDPETQRTVGTGLGLPIVKALVELHGGRVWLESVLQQGTKFYVYLPEETSDEDISD